MIKLSIIIPVYNVEAYLNKCIESVVNQTLKEIEIIMVNDGSPDNSKKIIESWMKKDKRIKLFNKENGGQASARNLGLTKANGEYIAFLDSDDYVDTTMYEKLYNKAKSENLDIVLCNYYLDYGNNHIVEKSKIFPKEGKINAEEYIVSTPSPVNKLFKKDFLDKINFKFPEGFIYEDLASIPVLGIYEPKIAYIDKCYYYYYQSPVSTMRNKEYKKKYEDIFPAIDYLYNKMIDTKFTKELEYLLACHLLYSGSLNFYKFKKYDMINKIANNMKKYFPNWKKNQYVKTKFTKKEQIYMQLFYTKKYKIIDLYKKIFNRT